jgi:hypothetical protein
VNKAKQAVLITNRLMLLIGLSENMSSLNLTERETLSSSLSTSNLNINIVLAVLRETKLKIKDPELFFSDRINDKAFIY